MKTYWYSAYTPQQSDAIFSFEGTLEDAIEKAKEYASMNFPQSEYEGYGPFWCVAESCDDLIAGYYIAFGRL